MNENSLADLIEQVESFATYSRPPLHSFLIQHRGRIVLERYWWGYSETSYKPLFSVTKSVVSALIGLALGDGKLTLSDTLAHWFPEFTGGAEGADVTLRHLLTMTSGFAPLKTRLNPADLPEALLRRPLATRPGELFYYENDALDLLVAVIERAVGEPTIDYACRRLFAPLGIWSAVPKSGRRRFWKVDKNNHIRGAYGLHLTGREMAAFGQLYLQGGCWNGEQIIPAAFVAESTTRQVDGVYPEHVRYGYLWWVTTDSSDHPAFFASGLGGQYIYVVPALELVTVITSSSQHGDGRKHRVMLTRMASKYVQTRS